MNWSALTAISVSARKLRAQRGDPLSKTRHFVFDFVLLVIICLLASPNPVVAQVEIGFPQSSINLRLKAGGNQVSRWRQGSWEILHVAGNAVIEHGRNRYSASEAILWIDTTSTTEQPSDVLLYLEQNVAIDVGEAAGTTAGQNRFTDFEWFGRIRTTTTVDVANPVVDISPDNAPDVFRRALQRRDRGLYPVQPAQYLAPANESGLSLISPMTGGVQQMVPPTATQLPPTGTGGFVTPFRSQSGFAPATQTTNVQILSRNQQTGGILKGRTGQFPGERIETLTGGIRVNIDSQELLAQDQLGQPKTSRLVIQAENVVLWRNPVTNADGTSGTRFEIYLEGNVIFAMGNRVIYADRMYYDATFRRGTILAADVITPVPSYQGLLRLKADVIQQTGEDQYQAYGASVTSSRLGVPRYWLQSDNVTLTGQDRTIVDPATGMTLVDPQTGEPGTGTSYFVESNSNTVYLGGVPVFYWPTLRTDLDNPSYYVERIRVGNDAVYGSQFGVGLDMFQLLGIRNRAEDLKWVGLVDYLSERGLGVGSDFDYRTASFFGVPGPTDGYIRSWFINDSGLDNLGRDRRKVPLEEDFRGRFQLRQRQVLAPGYSLRAEVGYLSDRNFLQQYYEREWDQQKDYTTGFWLERNLGNQSFNLTADARVNDFFTQTQWLPRGDHFILGQPLLFDRAVWHGHSTIGYGQFKTASTPTNAVDLAKFDPLAWEGVDRQGVVASTRHELDFPVQLGPVKVVPYVLGDASFWQQDLAGNELFRTYGQAGIRSSLPMWSVDPTVQSTLLNINGLAHKVSWDNEFLYAGASDGFGGLPLYNQLDDDAQEFFRRRFAFDTFGILPGMDTPLRFDERFYAHRYGIQSYVTSPSTEIADDLTLFRTGFRNRWQTRRGLPGEARIIDLVSFDVFASVFPDPNRDNFGEELGMIDYDFRWYIGDRLSLVSDGHLDVFDQGLRTASIGAHMSRPGVGNLYVGVRAIEGPISSNILTAAASYRMSDKWIVQGSTSTDFGDAGNIGQQLSFLRIGESFLVRFGVNADISRDNFGFAFGVEPRFLPDGRLGFVGGRRVPPAGATYLE